jgi:hypothetical protein
MYSLVSFHSDRPAIRHETETSVDCSVIAGTFRDALGFSTSDQQCRVGDALRLHNLHHSTLRATHPLCRYQETTSIHR